MSGQHQYKPNGQMVIERSGSSHSSFLSNIYLDPNCVIPESPTISITPTHNIAAGATHIVESPITSDSTWEERELSRIQSNDSGEYEDLDDPQICIRSNNYSIVVGGTKPLRVKKKIGVAAVKVGSKTKKRISIPHSPSPQYSRSFAAQSTSPRQFGYTGIKPRRNASSNSGKSNSSRTNANISSIFLNLPSESPTEKKGRMKGKIGKATRFCDSSLHLGLGKFTTYDPISPGPSPPSSPLPSPNKRTFVSTSTTTTGEYMKKPLPHPPSPLTPSRAPRKAAALLGASVPTGSAQNRKGGGKVHGLNTKHFRPLPHSTLTEIEKFFGDVPNKKQKPSATNSTTRSKPKSTGGTGGMDERGMGNRNVGSGETVKYKSENGSMWLDVEEEQEFARLLSEIFALIPQPLPDLTLAKVKSNETTGSQEEENKWEMEKFTSILSLPKPKSNNSSNTKTKVGKKTKVGSENSFLDLGLDTPKLPRNYINPWTSTPSHKRSLSNPTSPSSTIPKLSISSPMPALIPPPRTSSKAGPSSLPNSTTSYMDQVNWSVTAAKARTGSGSGSGSDSEGSTSSSGSGSGLNGSPPRIKNRPPPLTLKRIKPSGKLPILTATTPSSNRNNHQAQEPPAVPAVNRSKPQGIIPNDRDRYIIPSTQSRITKKHEAPPTPFVRPRVAPRPNPTEAIPPLPISIRQSQEPEHEPMSFFEPATPTEPKSKSNNSNSTSISNSNVMGSRDGSGGKEKKSWLKRVVKRPLNF
ncbi:hypothetical protein V865_001362 [Kwoniella europaea PYCC6329]|uniref:Uncharacterized protein n=1 Tax=Kwoniella europaea PYCC6329 TaxID=1423913 RepID=A0AAX4K9U4_9TREE